MLATLFLLMGLQTISVGVSAEPESLSETEDRVGLGSCVGEAGPLDLRRVMLLQNRILDLGAAGSATRVTLEGQIVRIRALDPGSGEGESVGNVGNMIGRGDEDADVELTLGMFEGRPVIYWRETFQHHIYRQGLLRINGFALERVCEGAAGVEFSH